MSAELVAHKPHCSNRNLLQLFALVLCAPLPTRRKLRFHLCNSCIGSLVFVVREPCVRSTRMRGILLRSRHAGEVARLSADLYCQQPVCRSLLATNYRLLRSQSRQCCPPATRSPWVPSRGGTAIWARRVKQPVRWTSCSQSELGGLHCANAEVQTREERGNCI